MSTAAIWGFAAGLLIVGLPCLFFAGPISRWNRRISRKWGWNVPAEGSSGAWFWGQKYLRVLGIIATSAGVVLIAVVLVRSA